MTILKRNGNLLNHFPSLFGNFLNREFSNWDSSNYSDTDATVPAVNIRETPDNYVVEVAAPGMSKKDFRVQPDGNMLTISSKKTGRDEENDNERYISREFSYQSFSRTFNLLRDVVDTDKIEGEEGILHLQIPKK